MSDWNDDMNAAPKDGITLLVFGDMGYSLAFWSSSDGNWWSNEPHGEVVIEPTHWMRLPNAPTP